MEFGQEFTYREYVADGIVHGFGVIAALFGAYLLHGWVQNAAPITHFTPIMAYSAGLIASFTLSAAYNMCLHKSARHVLRRFDHAAIFVMIAGTYTPIALIGIGGELGWALVAAAWVVAAVGIFLKLFFFFRFERLSFLLTFVQGWMAIVMIGPLFSAFEGKVLALLIGGGLIISLGVLFHLRDHWPFNRAIWHVSVLVGAAAHYAAVVMMANV